MQQASSMIYRDGPLPAPPRENNPVDVEPAPHTYSGIYATGNSHLGATYTYGGLAINGSSSNEDKDVSRLAYKLAESAILKGAAKDQARLRPNEMTPCPVQPTRNHVAPARAPSAFGENIPLQFQSPMAQPPATVQQSYTRPDRPFPNKTTSSGINFRSIRKQVKETGNSKNEDEMLFSEAENIYEADLTEDPNPERIEHYENLINRFRQCKETQNASRDDKWDFEYRLCLAGIHRLGGRAYAAMGSGNENWRKIWDASLEQYEAAVDQIQGVDDKFIPDEKNKIRYELMQVFILIGRAAVGVAKLILTSQDVAGVVEHLEMATVASNVGMARYEFESLLKCHTELKEHPIVGEFKEMDEAYDEVKEYIGSD
ncbi:hypothetical protein TWF694_007720 [Orbilia ellipsospora]|uniref:Uncharacterized protein n=1 Tax=Orbilia ellipsospora TaxID=2528407 RepID=A0AAV9XJ23_9PEZI